MWMRLGGRGIDTAADYGGHQAQVGAAVRAMIAQKVVNRSDVFITTKISPGTCSSQAAVAAVRADLVQLDLDYVDLVLQHFP
jgi:alcohol dehydrogenase (NADP+)